MRKPRPEAFNPKVPKRQMDAIDLTGVVPLQPKPEPSPTERSLDSKSASNVETTTPRYRDTVTPGNHDSVIPEHRDTVVSPPPDPFQVVRKAVKDFGKEAATHRFTQAEKQAIAELVYRYRARGIRTSENEIARIAINYLIHDYQVNGDQSILHRCLISLNE